MKINRMYLKILRKRNYKYVNCKIKFDMLNSIIFDNNKEIISYSNLSNSFDDELLRLEFSNYFIIDLLKINSHLTFVCIDFYMSIAIPSSIT